MPPLHSCNAHCFLHNLYIMHNLWSRRARLNESSEETGPDRIVLIELLGVALHAEHETLVGDLQQFDHAVLGTSAGVHTIAGELDRLMVQAVDPDLTAAEHLLHQASLLNIDAMAERVARLIPVGMEQRTSILVSQVLVERATEGSIDHW